GKDAYVGPTIQNCEHDLAAALFLELDSNAGIRIDESSNVERQELRDRRRVGPQAHHTDDAGRVIGEVGSELIDVAQNALCVTVESLAGDGKGYPARVTFQQFRTHRRLEVGDALAGGAHRETRQLSALADAAR